MTKQDWKDRGMTAIFGTVNGMVVGTCIAVATHFSFGAGEPIVRAIAGPFVVAMGAGVCVYGVDVMKESAKPRWATFGGAVAIASGLTLAGIFNSGILSEPKQPNPCKAVEQDDSKSTRVIVPEVCSLKFK